MGSHNGSIHTTHTPPPLSFYNTFKGFIGSMQITLLRAKLSELPQQKRLACIELANQVKLLGFESRRNTLNNDDMLFVLTIVYLRFTRGSF